jgi:homoserine kinase type II
MATLAKFHASVADFPAVPPLASSRGVAPAVTQRLARLSELQYGGIELLARSITDSTWPDFAAIAREFAAVLPAAVPIAIARLAPLAEVPLPLQPCIRDVWHDHVLFVGDQVTGLIDFGAMDIDTPTTDIARLLGSLVGDDECSWQEGLNAYSNVRPLSATERSVISARDVASTILAGCNWIRWIYLENRHFDDRPPIIARVERLLDRLRFVSRRA